jgi:hypothetical protein
MVVKGTTTMTKQSTEFVDTPTIEDVMGAQELPDGNAFHPDFMHEMSPAQKAWLRAHGFGFKKAQPYGFWIYKGDRSIQPISALPGPVYVLTEDRSEDGDGAKVVATFDRLRDALRFIVRGG